MQFTLRTALSKFAEDVRLSGRFRLRKADSICLSDKSLTSLDNFRGKNSVLPRFDSTALAPSIPEIPAIIGPKGKRLRTPAVLRGFARPNLARAV